MRYGMWLVYLGQKVPMVPVLAEMLIRSDFRLKQDGVQ
jgi:hypothetical protein